LFCEICFENKKNWISSGSNSNSKFGSCKSRETRKSGNRFHSHCLMWHGCKLTNFLPKTFFYQKIEIGSFPFHVAHTRRMIHFVRSKLCGIKFYVQPPPTIQPSLSLFLSLFMSNTHTHIRTNTHTHTQKRTHTHTYTHTYTHSHSKAHTDTYTHRHEQQMLHECWTSSRCSLTFNRM